MNAKRKRVERSKQHNPLCSEYRADSERKEDIRRNTEQRKKQKRALVETKKLINSDENDDEPNYAGVVAKPGSTKMRTKFHLRKEAKLHIQQTKKDKKRTKLSRKQRKMESQRNLEVGFVDLKSIIYVIRIYSLCFVALIYFVVVLCPLVKLTIL